MNREIVIKTRPLNGGGFGASVQEDSWADDSEDNPYQPYSRPGGSGFLGWGTFEEDREETEHDAYIVLRSRLRGFAAEGDVYDFVHESQTGEKGK